MWIDNFNGFFGCIFYISNQLLAFKMLQKIWEDGPIYMH